MGVPPWKFESSLRHQQDYKACGFPAAGFFIAYDANFLFLQTTSQFIFAISRPCSTQKKQKACNCSELQALSKNGAEGEIRTRTTVGHYPLKIACLPVPPLRHIGKVSSSFPIASASQPYRQLPAPPEPSASARRLASVPERPVPSPCRSSPNLSRPVRRYRPGRRR